MPLCVFSCGNPKQRVEIMKIWIVDAFTREPFRGNPAAVTIVDHFPDDALCSSIAAEMNLSETAFLKPLGQNHFHIRWFTPTTEIKLCGHATMASAHVLWEQGLVEGNIITFDSLSGPLRVYKSPRGITLDFPLQSVSHPLPTKVFQELFEQEVVAAVQAHDDVIVEVKDEEALRSLTPNMDRIRQMEYRGIIVTTKSETLDYDFKSRFFAPRVGVNEDPVTGSAHCKLADYWHKKTGKTMFRAYQASRRGGGMEIELIEDQRVYLTSNAMTILTGELSTPS